MGQSVSNLAAPDIIPDDSFSAEMRDSAAYAMEAAGRIAAQYRFAGLVAGVKGPNDTDRDVEEARAALIEAIQDFLTPNPRPLEEQIQNEFDALRQERAVVDRSLEESGILFQTHNIFPVDGHPSDQGPGDMEFRASDAADENLAQSIAAFGIGPEQAEQLWSLRRRARTIATLETQRRRKALADFRNFFANARAQIKAYYDDKIALIREGKYLLATTKILVDGIEVFHADIAIALIAAGIIAVTGGVTAVAAPIIVSAVAAAVRVTKVGAGVLRRTGDAVRHGAAASIFAIRIHRVDKSELDLPVARPHSHYERQVDTSRDLTNNERLLLNEEN
ncbi:MAG: hypothetical protein Q4G26_14855 [Paracoccus sp. (in: a-proteobacteria)]|nr:hypothetical protein [Paracoccus sp. (in: a-proteobacteria)]